MAGQDSSQPDWGFGQCLRSSRGNGQPDSKVILNQKLLEGRDCICRTLEYLGMEDVGEYLLTECV